MFCLFGIGKDDINGFNRIQLLKQTHPKIYDYCLNKLDLKTVMDYMNIPYI